MSEQDWRKKAKEFLEKFRTGFCCMKLTNPNGGMPKHFGVIYPDNVCKIFLRDEHGYITLDSNEWNSIDEMLDAGWDID